MAGQTMTWFYWMLVWGYDSPGILQIGWVDRRSFSHHGLPNHREECDQLRQSNVSLSISQLLLRPGGSYTVAIFRGRDLIDQHCGQMKVPTYCTAYGCRTSYRLSWREMIARLVVSMTFATLMGKWKIWPWAVAGKCLEVWKCDETNSWSRAYIHLA